MLRRATLLILLALFVHVFGFADDCDGRGVRRHFTIQSIPEQHVEAGYLWNYAGDVSVCGQCGWATNVPTAPTELSMNWGDGTSTPLSINMAGGQPHTTKASHTYDKPSGDPGVSFKPYAKAKAYCVAGWGQFWESIASNGEFFSESTAGRATGYDFASTPEVHVYPADKPTGIVVSATIPKNALTKGALTMVLEKPAPPSGTRLKIESSVPQLKILLKDGTSAADFRMPAGDSSALFDVDTRNVPNATQDVTFTISNVATGGSSLTKGPIPIR
jgi:hypothetical protein